MPDSRTRVTGPVKGGAHGWPFAAYLEDISALGYVEEEYFLTGVARRYRPLGAPGLDGRWSVEPAGEAPFTTRLLVQKPRDTGVFNGTVFVEWANVSSGYDVLPHDLPALLENGCVYAAVSAQYLSVHGHDGDSKGLTSWDPQRYGSLSHPGDSFSYDIYSQAASALSPHRPSGPVDPLEGLQVQRLIAVGASQSSWRLAA